MAKAAANSSSGGWSGKILQVDLTNAQSGKRSSQRNSKAAIPAGPASMPDCSMMLCATNPR